MYVIYRANKRKISVWPIIIFLLTLAFILIGAFWYIFLRDTTSTSASFVKNEQPKPAIANDTKVISTEYFNITTPKTWVNNGLKNPYSNQVYYELQDKKPKYEARYLRVYVDTFPANYPVNKIMVIKNDGMKLVAGEMSGDCASFPGAPKYNPATNSVSSWNTTWRGVKFTCDVANPINQLGAASLTSSYGQQMTGVKSGKHTYFLVYNDRNSRADYKIFTDLINSFQPI